MECHIPASPQQTAAKSTSASIEGYLSLPSNNGSTCIASSCCVVFQAVSFVAYRFLPMGSLFWHLIMRQRYTVWMRSLGARYFLILPAKLALYYLLIYQVCRYTGRLNPMGSSFNACFSPDGQFVLSGSLLFSNFVLSFAWQLRIQDQPITVFEYGTAKRVLW